MPPRLSRLEPRSGGVFLLPGETALAFPDSLSDLLINISDRRSRAAYETHLERGDEADQVCDFTDIAAMIEFLTSDPAELPK